ncbi:MAG: hypothetical protein AAB577_00125 [Patescibacteria group bacterium]
MKKYIAGILMINIVLASFPLAALAQEVPQTVGDAQALGLNILQRLPNAVRDIWQNQALPIWRSMWAWVKNLWDNTLGSKVQGLWEKLWGLTGQKTPDVKGEFQKEKQEMQKDLWERFKDLF